MSEYENAKIYKIVSKNTDKCYVGSTCQELKERLRDHKHKFKIDGATTSKHILKFGNYEIVLIENYCCENVEELKTRERFYIESMNCVNKNIPGRTKKQYYQDTKEEILEYQKHYHQNNKATILERKKKKYNCQCGGKFTHGNRVSHQKTKKHMKYLESIN